MKTTKDYYDLYLKCDVLLLVDVFEKFRTNSSINYGMFLSQNFNEPALSWDAMLSMTEFEIELSSDSNMYLVFKKVWEAEILTFLRDIAKPEIST